MNNRRNFGFSFFNPFIFSCLLATAFLPVSVQASPLLFKKAAALSVLMITCHGMAGSDSKDSGECTNIPLNDATIRTAVADYFISTQGTSQYGSSIGAWCTGDVTDMSDLFNPDSYADSSVSNQIALFNEDITNWDTSSLVIATRMFAGATSFNRAIGGWDLRNLEVADSMFSGATAFDQPIGDWDMSSLIDATGMFEGATAFNQPIGDWRMSSVKYVADMFKGATAFDQPIGGWDMSSVEFTDGMFEGATAFNQPIGDWVTSNFYNIERMFSGATAFDQPIGNWDVSNVRFASSVFLDATAFNQDIGDWNLGSATRVSFMFLRARNFNPNLCAWGERLRLDVDTTNMFLNSDCPQSATDVDLTADPKGPFCRDCSFVPLALDDASIRPAVIEYLSGDNARKFDVEYQYGRIENWNTASVTNMSSLFDFDYYDGQYYDDYFLEYYDDYFVSPSSLVTGVTLFNEPIGSWDMSGVTTAFRMFAGATSFNQPIGNWTMFSVLNVEAMFFGASSFNQDLCAWGDSLRTDVNRINMFAVSGCPESATPVNLNADPKGPLCRPCTSIGHVTLGNKLDALASQIGEFQSEVITCSRYTVANGVDSNTTRFGPNAVQLNSEGHPAMSYYEFDSVSQSSKVIVTGCSDPSCAQQPFSTEIDSGSSSNGFSTMRFNDQNHPRVVYCEQSTINLVLCDDPTCAQSGPTIMEVASGLRSDYCAAGNIQMELTGDGYPVVLYEGSDGNNKIFACNETCTSPEIIDLAPFDLGTASLQVADGAAFISYLQVSFDDLYLIKCELLPQQDCFGSQPLSSSFIVADSTTVMRLDSNGHPVIGFTTLNTHTFKSEFTLVGCQNPACGIPELGSVIPLEGGVSSLGATALMQLDAQDRPLILWSTPSDPLLLNLVECSDPLCTSTTTNSIPLEGTSSLGIAGYSFQLVSDDALVIASIDGSSDELIFQSCLFRSTLETRIDGLDEGVATLSGQIDDVKSKVEALELDMDLAPLATQIDELDGKVEGLNDFLATELDAQDAFLATLSGKVELDEDLATLGPQLNGKLDTLATQVGDLDEDLATELDEQDGFLATLSDKVDDLDEDLATLGPQLNGKLDTLATQVGDLDEDLAAELDEQDGFLATLSDKVDDLDEDLATLGPQLNGKLDTLATQVGDLGEDLATELDAQDAFLATLSGKVDDLDEDLATLGPQLNGKLDTLATQVGDLDEDLAAELDEQDGFLATLSDKVDDLDEDLATLGPQLNGKLDTLATQVGDLGEDLATELDAQDAFLATLSGKVDDLDEDLATLGPQLNGKLDTLATQVGDLDEDLAAELDNQDGFLATLSGKVDELDEDLATLGPQLNGKLDTLATQVGDLDEDLAAELDAQDAFLATLSGKVDDLDEDLATLGPQLNGKLDTLATQVGDLDEDLAAELDAQDGFLATLGGKVDELDEDLATLRPELNGKLDGLDTELDTLSGEIGIDSRNTTSQLEGLATKLDKIDNCTSDIKDDIEGVNSGLQAEIDILNRKIDLTSGDLINTNSSLTSQVKALRQDTQDSIDKLGTLVVCLEQNWRRWQRRQCINNYLGEGAAFNMDDQNLKATEEEEGCVTYVDMVVAMLLNTGAMVILLGLSAYCFHTKAYTKICSKKWDVRKPKEKIYELEDVVDPKGDAEKAKGQRRIPAKIELQQMNEALEESITVLDTLLEKQDQETQVMYPTGDSL